MPISKRSLATQNKGLFARAVFRPAAATDLQRTDWEGAVEDFLAAKARSARLGRPAAQGTLDNYRQFLLGGPTRSFLAVQVPPVTDVRQLTAELVVDFKRQLLAMRETLPDGTLVSAARKQSYADTFHRRFHTFLGWCEQTGRLGGASPLRALEYPREDAQAIDDIKILTNDELRAVYAACRSERDHFLIRWYLRTGARLGEANISKDKALIADELLAGPKAMIWREKVNKWTPVPLDTAAVKFSKEVRHYLDKVRPKDDDGVDALFLTDRRYRDGKGLPKYRALSTSGIKELIERIWRSSGVDECHAHLFRHRWATDMIRGGMSPTVLMKIGGWTDYRMVNRYVHLVAADLIEAAAKVTA